MRQIKYIFLFSILFFSCNEITHINDFSNNYSFLCVLKNDQVIQRAGLYKLVDIKANYPSSYKYLVQDAEITLSDGIISSQLKVRELPVLYYSEYFYSDDSVFNEKILPNTKYDIQIKVKDEIITGSTTTPGEFVINIPNNTIELEKDAIGKEYIGGLTIYKYRLNWSKSINSSNYIIYTYLAYRDARGELYAIGTKTSTADTFAILDIPNIHPGSLNYSDRTYYPESAKFTVIAVDKNYYDYHFLSRDRAGLSGQYGVFGSSIVDSCVVSVKY